MRAFRNTSQNAKTVATTHLLANLANNTMNIQQVINTADEARQYAIDWQRWESTMRLSYSELAEWQAIFEELAQRFPELQEEFKDNGII